MTKWTMECGSKVGEMTSKSSSVLYTVVENRVLGHITPLWVRYSKTLTGSDLCSFFSWRHQRLMTTEVERNEYTPLKLDSGILNGLFYVPKVARFIERFRFDDQISYPEWFYPVHYDYGGEPQAQTDLYKDKPNEPCPGSYDGLQESVYWRPITALCALISKTVLWRHNKFVRDKWISYDCIDVNNMDDPKTVLYYAG